jgi:hypothetical protein
MLEPYGVTIFCDDIRYEIGGKRTFVGVYNEALNVVGVGQVALPAMHFAIEMLLPLEYSAKVANLKVLKQKFAVAAVEETLFEVSLPEVVPMNLEPFDEQKLQRVAMSVAVGNLIIEESFRIKVRCYLDGREIKLGSLSVHLSAPETTGLSSS